MKRIVLLLVAMTMTGCTSIREWGYTPAYTERERSQQIARNWEWERKQINDDIDHMLLLKPPGHLSIWHLR